MPTTLAVMDTDELTALRAAARAGSLSAAARDLGTSQPNISRRIARLEHEIGAQLLVREPRGVRVTAVGRQVLDFAIRTLDEIEQLASLTSADGGTGLSGMVRVVASTTPGEYLLPRIVSAFSRANPDVGVSERVTDSAGVVATLLAGECDIGLSGRPSGRAELIDEPFAEDEILLAVPTAHPLAERGRIGIGDLAGERLILREHGSGTQQVFLEALAHHGKVLPSERSLVSLGSTHAVIVAVADGAGIGVVSRLALDQHRQAPIARVRLTGVPMTRRLYVVHVADRRLSPAVEAFRKHLLGG